MFAVFRQRTGSSGGRSCWGKRSGVRRHNNCSGVFSAVRYYDGSRRAAAREAGKETSSQATPTPSCRSKRTAAWPLIITNCLLTHWEQWICVSLVVTIVSKVLHLCTVICIIIITIIIYTARPQMKTIVQKIKENKWRCYGRQFLSVDKISSLTVCRSSGTSRCPPTNGVPSVWNVPATSLMRSSAYIGYRSRSIIVYCTRSPSWRTTYNTAPRNPGPLTRVANVRGRQAVRSAGTSSVMLTAITHLKQQKWWR